MTAPDPTPPRDGPLLRVIGGCEGCAHLRRGLPPLMWGIIKTRACAAMQVHGHSKMIGNDYDDTATPTWCPRLTDARAALGRELVEEAEPSLLDLVSPEEAAIHRRMGSTPIIDADIVGPAVGVAGRVCQDGSDVGRTMCKLRMDLAREASRIYV